MLEKFLVFLFFIFYLNSSDRTIEVFLLLPYPCKSKIGVFMSIIDKITLIGNMMEELFNFVQSNENIKQDFDEYVKTLNLKTEPEIRASAVSYIFERRLNDENETVLSLFSKEKKSLSKEQKKIVKAFQNNVDSVFEVKKVGKNGFEIESLINEKTYFAISMVKMTHFRQIGSGDFILARIMEYENEYYMLEIRDAIKASEKQQVYKFAIAKILEEPQKAFLDNKDKQKEIEKSVTQMYNRFLKCFQDEEVITTNYKADKLIEFFNDNSRKKVIDENALKELVEPVESFGFFKINDYEFEYQNFIEKSMGGFANCQKKYDVGLICQKPSGFYAIPFLGTFEKIFELDDYKSIENYKDCIVSFLSNSKIPLSLFERMNGKYPDFVKRINEILETNMTFEELMKKYKKEYFEEKIYSPTCVLFCSKTFSKLLEEMNLLQNVKSFQNSKNIGRNDPCPCGSGKKYKNCCLKVVLATS